MPLTSRPLAPQHASTRCLISVLLSTQIAMKRHGAGCGDVRLGCWQIAGSSGHRRLSVIARSASRWTRAPAVQCCPRMIWGRASSERRSFIRYDKVSRSRGSNWRRGCRGGGPLGTGWRLKGHAPDAVLALSAPAPPSHIVVRLSRMATRPPCAAVDLRRDSDHHARAAHPRCATDRKSTRLNSSHEWSSYAVFCLKKKKKNKAGNRKTKKKKEKTQTKEP